MWDAVADCVQRSAEENLGLFKGGGNRMEGAWWWNKEVKEKVSEKKEAYADFMNSGADGERDIRRARYKTAKKVAKKAVAVAKSLAYDRLYQRLATMEGEKEVFKLARARERRTRDLGGIIPKNYGKKNTTCLKRIQNLTSNWRMYAMALSP